MTHITARGTERKNLALRNDNTIACYGRTASTMTVSQTNEAFAAAKRKQQGKK